MLFGIFIFIVFLGPLVFVHELGHFIFAKLFGVRVEVFSIGFGPKILKYKKGDTEYAVSLIPLGGYVKMFGEDTLRKDEIKEEEKKFSFNHKNKWERFWIVFAGPLFNIVFTFFIFLFLSFSGEKFPEIKFGVVAKDSKFYQLGIRTADVVVGINGEEIKGPTDVSLGEKSIITDVTLRRKQENVVVHLKSEQNTIGMSAQEFFSYFESSLSILRAPVVVDVNGESFLVGTSKNSPDWSTSFEELAELTGVNTLYFWKVADIEKKVLANETVVNELTWNSVDSSFIDYLAGQKLYINDLVVRSVKDKSPAAIAGILANDVIVSFNDIPTKTFEDLRNNLQKIGAGAQKIQVLRKGELKEFVVIPEKTEIEGKSVWVVGVESGARFLGVTFTVAKPAGPIDAVVRSSIRTWDTCVQVFVGFKKLVTNEVSLKNIGGPIAIGKIATDSFNTSITYFFQIMAVISVNLGIINLFPIPVLDGGHIMFIIFEMFNRGPLSKRKIEIAHRFGISFLFLLMFVALFNDFMRFIP